MPAIPKKKTSQIVWAAKWEHKHGEDISLHTTEEGAGKQCALWAREALEEWATPEELSSYNDLTDDDLLARWPELTGETEFLFVEDHVLHGPDVWDEVWDEETLSNHYHTDDGCWEHDIDPKECKNLKDFFKKRITIQIKAKRDQAKEDQEKEAELKILRAKENKLKKYTSIEEFSNNQLGSVYWFVDVKQKFAKSEKLSFGVLYVGESRNFNSRFSAYAHKEGDRYSALEQRLINKFPKRSKSEIKAFVRDREQCKLRVITNKNLSHSDYRLRCERRLIAISQPLLNLK